MIIEEKIYKPMPESRFDDYGFKTNFNIFKKGFVGNGSIKNILLLGVICALWIFVSYYFITYLTGVIYSYPVGKYVFIFFTSMFAFPYCLQQYLLCNHLLYMEDLIKDNPIKFFFKKFHKFLGVLAVFYILTYISFTLTSFGLSFVDIALLNQGEFLKFFLNFKNTSIILLVLFFNIVLYLYMLSFNLVFIAEGLDPIKKNILKQNWAAFKKIVKMFPLIWGTLIFHIIVLLICLSFISWISDLLVENAVIDKNYGVTIIVGLTLFIQFALMKAKLKSFAMVFILTENIDEYKDRLTLPKAILPNEKVDETKNEVKEEVKN